VSGAQEGVDPAHAGVNTNLLAPGRLVDVPSGNAVVNGYPVTVTRTEVPGSAGVAAWATAGAGT